MRKAIKMMLVGVVALLAFYNLSVSKTTNSDATISLIENSALANEEDEAGYYYSRTHSTGTGSYDTELTDSTHCTTEWDYYLTICLGEGKVGCQPIYLETNLITDCP